MKKEKKNNPIREGTANSAIGCMDNIPLIHIFVVIVFIFIPPLNCNLNGSTETRNISTIYIIYIFKAFAAKSHDS